MTVRAFAWGVPAALLAGSLTMRGLLRFAPPLAQRDLAQPLPVANAWHGFGALQAAVALGAVGLAAVCYLRCIRARPEPGAAQRWYPVAVVTSVGLFAAWMAPLVFSSDAYAYATYGELARLGADPYVRALLPTGNPIFDAAIVQWGNPIPACVYGLPFVWLAQGIVTVAHGMPVAVALVGFRVAASLGLVALVPLGYALFEGDGRLRAATTIGLHPAAIWCAAEGHNDGLAIGLLLAGLALARRGRPLIGGFLAGAAGAVKLPAIAGGPIAGRFGRLALAGGIIGTLAAVACSVPILYGLGSGAPSAQYAPQVSVQALLLWLGRMAFGSSGGVAAAWLAVAMLAAACATSGVRYVRAGRSEGWCYLAAAGWLLVPNPYPWYGLWLLPLAAAAPGTKGAAALLGLSFGSMLRYLPDVVATPAPIVSAALGCAAGLPLLLLLGRPARRLL